MKSFQLHRQTEEEKIEEKKSIKNFLKKVGLYPQYTEISLFLSLIAAVLVIATHPEAKDILGLIFDPTMIPVVLFTLPGVLFVLYYALNLKASPQTTATRGAMMFCGFVIQVINILILTSLSLSSASLWGIALAIFNFVHLWILLTMIDSKMMNHDAVSTQNAKLTELIVGLVSVLVIFVISRFQYQHPPALTFSLICSYSMMLNEVVSGIFVKRGNHASIE